MEKLGDDAEEATQKQDITALNKTTKSLAGGFKNNGIVEQMQRWKIIF